MSSPVAELMIFAAPRSRCPVVVMMYWSPRVIADHDHAGEAVPSIRKLRPRHHLPLSATILHHPPPSSCTFRAWSAGERAAQILPAGLGRLRR
jgi:hypothetical protein